ncbi:MAG: hypothetical protein Q8Q59_04415 [Luteolibacter sp.]|jgi:hypothetical protein|nr:hypothetical protein [Luteolibacter sp.]
MIGFEFTINVLAIAKIWLNLVFLNGHHPDHLVQGKRVVVVATALIFHDKSARNMMIGGLVALKAQ